MIRIGRILLFYIAVITFCPALPAFGCADNDAVCPEQSAELPDSDQYPESDCICTDCCNMIYIEPGTLEIDALGEVIAYLESAYLHEPSEFDSSVWNPPDMG